MRTVSWRVMAEDVDPEIAAALAKLAQQDAGSAGNAEAALEWIVGELSLAAITQKQVQNFCWYQLPMKWLISHDEKHPARMDEGLQEVPAWWPGAPQHVGRCALCLRHMPGTKNRSPSEPSGHPRTSAAGCRV
jgi:hypothetical protein